MGKKKAQRGGAREGAGRPRELDSAVTVAVVIDAKTLAQIDAEAAKRETSRSAEIRRRLASPLWAKPAKSIKAESD